MKKIKNIFQKLTERRELSYKEIKLFLDCIDKSKVTPSQIGAFLMGLKMKGLSINEIFYITKIMRMYARQIKPKVKKPLIDTCGTGGGIPTINISTAVAIVASAGGIPVAKHGSRSISSRSGSADVLEKLHMNINLTPKKVERMIEKIYFGFLYAPNFHPLMKKIWPYENLLRIKTIFYTFIGPLINPANVKRQIIGVYKPELVDIFSEILKRFRYRYGLVVHGKDGLDEISTLGPTIVAEVRKNKIEKYEVVPEDFGIKRAKAKEILGGSPTYNARVIKKIFEGKLKNSKRDIIIINSAGAFVVGGVAKDLFEGIEIAKNVIDEGLANKKLKEIAIVSNTI